MDYLIEINAREMEATIAVNLSSNSASEIIGRMGKLPLSPGQPITSRYQGESVSKMGVHL